MGTDFTHSSYFFRFLTTNITSVHLGLLEASLIQIKRQNYDNRHLFVWFTSPQSVVLIFLKSFTKTSVLTKEKSYSLWSYDTVKNFESSWRVLEHGLHILSLKIWTFQIWDGDPKDGLKSGSGWLYIVLCSCFCCERFLNQDLIDPQMKQILLKG